MSCLQDEKGEDEDEEGEVDAAAENTDTAVINRRNSCSLSNLLLNNVAHESK